MIDTAPLAPIPFSFRRAVAGIEDFGSARIASRMIEFLLAAGGPQARLATVADHIAANFGFTPVVAAEVHAFGQEVSSLSPSSFARLQDLAWADCSDDEVEEHTAQLSSRGDPAPIR